MKQFWLVILLFVVACNRLPQASNSETQAAEITAPAHTAIPLPTHTATPLPINTQTPVTLKTTDTHSPTSTSEPANTSTPNPTDTPTPNPTGTPTLEPTPEIPSENIVLAQAAVGSGITVHHVDTIEVTLVSSKDDQNPTTKPYILAYDENGIIVARFSAENGNEQQWIAGGPFASEEINNGSYSNFPCGPNSFGYCGVGIWISSYLEYGLYLGGDAIRLLDGKGDATPFFMEAAVIGYYIARNGEQQTVMIPIMIANENTGQRMGMGLFQEDPLPSWAFSDHLTRISEFYFYTHWDETLYDNPQEVNYYLDEDAVMPILGFGDSIGMSFPIPGRTPKGNPEVEDSAAFLLPLTTTYYFGDGYNEFLSSGEVVRIESGGVELMKINGIPVLIPNNGVNWNGDTFR